MNACVPLRQLSDYQPQVATARYRGRQPSPGRTPVTAQPNTPSTVKQLSGSHLQGSCTSILRHLDGRRELLRHVLLHLNQFSVTGKNSTTLYENSLSRRKWLSNLRCTRDSSVCTKSIFNIFYSVNLYLNFRYSYKENMTVSTAVNCMVLKRLGTAASP